MGKGLLAFALVLALQGTVDSAPTDNPGADIRSFSVQPGDTLVINNDFGRVRIRSWDGTGLEVRTQKTTRDQAGTSVVRVESRKSGATVSVNTHFSGAADEAVDLEIRTPGFVNVTVSGQSADVDVADMQGIVRAQTTSGRIIAENLTAATSLVTESGDITYRFGSQPQGDVTLESTSGNLYCEMEAGVNLRNLIRAGGTISWDMDATLQATSVEKQLGTGGPLLYAGTTKGNVVVRVKPALVTPTTVASISATQSGEASHERPVPAVAPPQPPEAQATDSARAPAAPSVQEARRERPAVNSRTSESNPPPSAPAPPDQQAGSKPTAEEGQHPLVLSDTLKVDVDSVFLNVSVRDRNTNRSIAGLQKSDFRIYEDGVEQEVAQFLPSEAPFNLLLLLDVSGSTASYLKLMKQAAIDFTHEIKENDRVAIATFNNSVELVQNFTSDRTAAERAINRIRSGGGTAFYDALMTCLDRYMRGIEGRSAIVVFTDGVDNQLEGRGGSMTRYDQLYRRVQEADTIIYTIFLDTEGDVMSRVPARRPGGIGGYPGGRRGGRFPGGGFPFPIPYPQPTPSPYPRPYPRGQRNEGAVYEEARNQLQEIADQTGGRMYTPHKIDELSGVYSEIADDLRIQYQLGYNSTNRAHNGTWREIRVQVDNHPEAVVRTRKGYYAHKDAS